MHYDLTTLDNGLRVITESMPEVRSAAIGCWVDTGSRDETPEEAGSSHFLEHLLFKGTDEWSAQQIAETFDAVGAQSNAFTSKEYTCYWARMRDENVPLGLELLSEMTQRPAFRPDDIDSERHVVLEEINMNEDDPTDVAYERFARALWEGHLLEYPILGTKDSINATTPDIIRSYWGRRYSPRSMVVSVAGNIDHAAVVELASKRFGDWEGTDVGHDHSAPPMNARVKTENRDTEQAHIVLGGEGLTRDDDRRFAFGVLTHILGGGMSSRLFREIREKRGLAYAVYMFRWPFADAGAYGVYVGTTPSQTDEVLQIVNDELAKAADSGVTEQELERAKGHSKGSLALSLEDPNSRMHRLGRAELAGMEHLSVDEIVRRVEAVTTDDVKTLAAEVFGRPKVIGATGPFDSADLESHVS